MQVDWWVGGLVGWTAFLLGEILKSPGERRDFLFGVFFLFGDFLCLHHCWLVVWNMAYIFPSIGNNHPN